MSELVVSSSLKEFFKLLIGEVANRQKVTMQEVTEFYLVNLLSDYAASERLFTHDDAGKRDTEPLALMYHRAQLLDRDEKLKTLRRLGDVSLYTAGFFSQSLNDRMVGPEYYVDMGRAAYATVAQMSAASAFSSVYEELHQKFLAIVDVLEEIAARGLVAQGPTGQMRVFESYASSRKEHLGTVLLDIGMVPKKGFIS